MKMIKIFSSVFLAAFLVACGGSSSDGGSDPLTLTSQNTSELAVVSAETTKQLVATDSNPFGFKSSLKNTSAGGTCPDGGTYNFVSTNSGFSYTFNNCSYGSGFFFDGTMSAQLSNNGDNITFDYDFTYSFDGSTETIVASGVCTGYTSATPSCTFNYSDISYGTETYSFETVEALSGDELTGYSYVITVSTSEGAATLDADNLVLCTDGSGYVESGTMTITSNGQTAVINFIDCTQFSVTFEGSTTTYNYADF